MPTLIEKATLIEAAGNQPKRIEEYIGQVSSGTDEVSIARMVSPEGWEEPGQQPEFKEYTVVLAGTLRVSTPSESIDVKAGQAIMTYPGDWVRYSTPFAGGAEYISVCMPAFSQDSVNRDSSL